MFEQFHKNQTAAGGVDASQVHAEFTALQSPRRECVDCQQLLAEASATELIAIAPAVVELQKRQDRPSAHFICACLELARRIEQCDHGRGSAGELYDQSLRLARRARDPFLEAHVQLRRGDFLESSGRRPQAAEAYEDGVKLFKKHFCDDSPRMLPYLAVLSRLYEGLGWRDDAESTRDELRAGLRRHAGTDDAFEAILEFDAGRVSEFERPVEQSSEVALSPEAMRERRSIGEVLTLLRQGQQHAALGEFSAGKGRLLSAHLLLDDRDIAAQERVILVQVLAELCEVCERRGEVEEGAVYGRYAARVARTLGPAHRAFSLQVIRERREAVADGAEHRRERAELDYWLAEFGGEEP